VSTKQIDMCLFTLKLNLRSSVSGILDLHFPILAGGRAVAAEEPKRGRLLH
jgi:hypothetical protein